MNDEEYLNSLHAQNEELEMEIQIQCEERLILEKRIETMKKLLSEFEQACSGKASDKMQATIKKWRSFQNKIAKENIV